ncbi:NAD-dependent epimerase/dehydratase family protein [Zunongwangia sp.]|uniref:NAD-dependent epimerase/dehydratase family protein n=1 Tax=Zunongwangia sp. TaxID=1965325 RepID=UPI003AA9704C
MVNKILVIGACGQIGTELTQKLREIHGSNAVIASDIKPGAPGLMNAGPFEVADVMNEEQVKKIVVDHNIKEVYLMAAMLSATAEQNPLRAWDLNMKSLLFILNLAKERYIEKIFWPSSIAVFGPTTPKENTPQDTIMDPSTVYGISKQAGERWCSYYNDKFAVDVRSLRYPGIISYKTKPGGGTTDYAVEIFYEAVQNGTYTSFIDKDTSLPMMYMEDAIKATVDIMEAPKESIKVRSSYNLAAMSFTPKILANCIQKHLANFTIDYKPDFRQQIAESWPSSINDLNAREDWGWKPNYGIEELAKGMLEGVKKQLDNIEF